MTTHAVPTTSRAADRARAERERWAQPGGFHDRLVKVFAWGLPAAAGAVAAVMILSPIAPRSEISFLLDRNKVAVTDERLRVDDAIYRGADNKGRPFSLVAESASQRSAKVPQLVMRGLKASILLDGGPAQIVAPDGVFDLDANTVAVDGTIRFTASDGYSVSATGVEIDLEDQVITGSGGVSGAIPAGTFSAGSMRVDLPTRTLRLSGRAKFRMIPGRLRMP
ncbi:LPS export ABC transporter periplasmic protein LptC [Pseudoblastomonas halimionae]|uniref:LPS export ABC transporter periplasmic protein LptC n=1 Tax=Alteriqipengyuania halimionae TaxID=1926630 RepID=UPI002D7FCE4B|nr:LPS export ABC transporter periplasmic protein LptC [Alteriqipengyuania halimionae]